LNKHLWTFQKTCAFEQSGPLPYKIHSIMAKTILVTGASAGIGQATAIYLAQHGYNVYGAARRIDKMQDLKTHGIKPIALDVTQDESILSCVNQIRQETGSIDVLVNNAGFGSYGAIEDVALEDARYQLEVNVFGAMRLTQLVLPIMREYSFGKIVNISSVGGKSAFPLGGWYHASKFALEALSDALRREVKQFGVDVIVIEPGGIKSEWGTIAFDSLLRVSGNTVYQKMAVGVEKFFKGSSATIPEPIVIAELIKKAIEAKSPQARYSGGYMAAPSLFMARFIPDKLQDKIIASQINS
jgi:short-subunit dehydrogenase